MVLWWKPQCNRTESWLPTPCSRLLVLCSCLRPLELRNSRHMTPDLHSLAVAGADYGAARLTVPPSEHNSSHTTQLPDLLHSPYGYSDVVPVLEQIHSLPPLRSHLTYAPVYTSNGALAHMPLGPMHNTLLDPRSQVDLNSRVDQLTQKVDDQNNLIGQLLRQINLNQGPNLGPRRRRPDVQSVRDDSARSSSGLVPHSTIRVDRQLQGVRHHFHKGVHLLQDAFKKGLPTEHELYRELAITPSQTLAEVFATAERYALWDDDRIAAKKASK
ncbi:unnamed protein product [Prunus brigantina]